MLMYTGRFGKKELPPEEKSPGKPTPIRRTLSRGCSTILDDSRRSSTIGDDHRPSSTTVGGRGWSSTIADDRGRSLTIALATPPSTSPPFWVQMTGKLFTLQRTAVFSDILSLGAIAGKTGNVSSGNSTDASEKLVAAGWRKSSSNEVRRRRSTNVVVRQRASMDTYVCRRTLTCINAGRRESTMSYDKVRRLMSTNVHVRQRTSKEVALRRRRLTVVDGRRWMYPT